MSIADLSPSEFTKLVLNASSYKTAVRSGQTPKTLSNSLAGQTIAMMFNKRSTRTRVSTEAAVTLMGGHPMFLGKDDIQLGVSAPSWHLTTPIFVSDPLHRSMSLSVTRPPLSRP